MQQSHEKDITLSEALEAFAILGSLLEKALRDIVKALTKSLRPILDQVAAVQKSQGKHKGTRQQFASLNHVKVQHPDFQMKKMSPQVTIRTPVYPVKKII